MKRNPLRVTVCFFLSFMAGLSFVTSVLPVMVSTALQMPSLAVQVEIDRFTVHVALVWAVSGGVLAWLGGTLTGTLLLGSCGLASGLFLGIAALSGVTPAVVASALSGVIYGASAGALLGKLFPRAR